MPKVCRALLACAVALGALATEALLQPKSAQATGIFDRSHYRPVYGKSRGIFRNPVGRLDTRIPRKLPSLTVKAPESTLSISGGSLSGPKLTPTPLPPRLPVPDAALPPSTPTPPLFSNPPAGSTGSALPPPLPVPPPAILPPTVPSAPKQ